MEHCSWEEAAPPLKDSNRVPDPSTLRRWSNGLERSQLAPSFLRQTLARVSHWLTRSDQADHQAWLLSDSDCANSLVAPASLRSIFSHPPSSPGNAGDLLLRSVSGRKKHRGRGRRKTQTAPAAARLSAAAELGRQPCRSRLLRVRRTLSVAPGNSAFVLRQCSQKSLLLPRLWPGSRSRISRKITAELSPRKGNVPVAIS